MRRFLMQMYNTKSLKSTLLLDASRLESKSFYQNAKIQCIIK